MTSFNAASAALGGLLIGLATVLLMALIGRTAGISGIFAGTLDPQRAGAAWRVAFIIGLIAAPFVVAVTGHVTVAPAMPSWTAVVAGGILVGFGTRLAGGCTSGHGICGLARLSPRSLSATVTFMAAAAIVVALTRHVAGGL